MRGHSEESRMIDYTKLAYPKTKLRATEKAEKQADIAKQDKAESAKAKKRAKGQCEAWENTPNPWNPTRSFTLVRCKRKDTQTHHLISGIGRRNKGKSILAEHKLRVCDQCHADLHAKILQPTTATDEAASVRYRRAR
jgi:hypothetical protein